VIRAAVYYTAIYTFINRLLYKTDGKIMCRIPRAGQNVRIAKSSQDFYASNRPTSESDQIVCIKKFKKNDKKLLLTNKAVGCRYYSPGPWLSFHFGWY